MSAVCVTIASSTHLLSCEQLQRYPASLLPSLVADPAVSRGDSGELCVTLSPAAWGGKADDDDDKAADFVMELYKSGSLLLACKQLPRSSFGPATFQQLTAALDYLQLPTEQVLSVAALASARDAAPDSASLSPQLLRMLSLAMASEAAQQVLELQYKYRQGLNPGLSARYVVTMSEGEPGLQVFAYAPDAAGQAYAACIDEPSLPRRFCKLCDTWIGTGGRLLQGQHLDPGERGFFAHRQGYPGIEFLHSSWEFTAQFIMQSSQFTAFAVSDIQVKFCGYLECRSMRGVTVRW